MAGSLSANVHDLHARSHALFQQKHIPKMAFLSIMAFLPIMVLLAVFSCLVKDKFHVLNHFVRFSFKIKYIIRKTFPIAIKY